MRRLSFVTFLGTMALVGCARTQETSSETAPAPAPPAPSAAAPATSATATLTGQAGSGIHGTVSFQAMPPGVHVEARVEGAAPGSHGFHLHETGDCSAADFSSAGGHFNPTGVAHGGPQADPHHAGDLGNLEIGADGTGTVSVHSDLLAIGEGPNAVVGRAVVFHEQADDFATQPTGNAGGRLACGVIAAGPPTS